MCRCMTVLEAIQKSREFLESRKVESARLEAELLLGHVLQLPRLQLYLQFERLLSTAETDLLRTLVKRRGAREPLQHILGTACFCGLEIAVNPQVLIPRPETEILAELGWKYLRSLDRPAKFLDFGTGSGCLAIAICHHVPEHSGVALDKSFAAIETARLNSRTNKVSERLEFIESDGFSALPSELKFDLIISNPPYIPAEEIATLQPEVRDFDPRPALDGGVDGLDFYRLLASRAPHFLLPGGKLMMEFGDGLEKALRPLFEQDGWIIESIEPDFHKKPRVLIARTA